MLSAESVIQAGVSYAQHEGLAALSLRSLAEHLAVTPMALYRHVETAEALKAAVVDAMLAKVPPVSANEGWSRAAREWAPAARRVLAAHPGLARRVLTQWFRLPRVLDFIEALLAAAERDGMSGPSAVAAVNAIFTYVLMRAEAEEAIRSARVVHRKLPRGARSQRRWPRLKANAAEYEVARLDVHFAFGLDALLLGMEQRRKHGSA